MEKTSNEVVRKEMGLEWMLKSASKRERNPLRDEKKEEEPKGEEVTFLDDFVILICEFNNKTLIDQYGTRMVCTGSGYLWLYQTRGRKLSDLFEIFYCSYNR